MVLRFRSFIYGLTLPHKAARLILSKRNLLFLSLLPIGVTLIFYIYSIQFLKLKANALLTTLLLSWSLNPESGYATVIFFFSHIIIFLISALTFSSISNMIASPFNDFLAEATEKHASPPLPPAADQSIPQKIRLIFIDLIKAIAATTLSIIALLSSWIPIVNFVTFMIAFLLVTFQYVSYPQTRRNIGLKEGMSFLFQHLYACAGFGASLSILFAIPFLSGLMLPLAVVGGTLLAARAQNTPESWKLH